ncbi:MAG: hypothetical protein ABEJ94_06380 [Halorientalis sp.]
MSEDTEERWTGFEVGDGDYVVCDPDNPDAWLRSDTVVTLADRPERERDESTRRR